MAKDKFLVCVVLDETGSMYSIKDDTIGGYNEYIDSLRDQKNTKVLLVRFNSNEIKVGEITSIKDATELTDKNYTPQAATPLYDAIAKAVYEVENVERNRHIIFAILTDGLENASREYNKKLIFEIIKDKTGEGWKFVYLGANQDAFAVGAGLGIAKGNVLNYDTGKIGETLNIMTSSTRRYMQDPSKKLSEDYFDDEDREKVK
jgi:hypothetical protein